MIILGFSNGPKGKFTERDIILKPFGSDVVNLSLGNTPIVYFINDFGGTESQNYQCNSSSCTLVSTK